MKHAILNEIRVIRRDEIPALTSITIGGGEHPLGILKEFRRNPILGQFLPETSRMSLSWVHLGANEVLDPHVHPTESMIVMTQGDGILLDGKAELNIGTGDVIVIPRDCSHGFIGKGTGGYWALSVQFEGLGLYEDTANARVAFEQPMVNPFYELLLAANRHFREQYTRNEIFKFVKSDAIDDKAARGRLLDSILVWSNYFQRVVLARSAFTDDVCYSKIFKEHLDEEYNHNTALARDRGNELVEIWDPILESTSSWFAWKMMTLDNLDKLVLVHIVLEAAATEWHRVAHPIMSKYRETNHFQTHDQMDHNHEDLGLKLLSNIDAEQFERLSSLQKEGWGVMNAMCDRMATLATQVRQ